MGTFVRGTPLQPDVKINLQLHIFHYKTNLKMKLQRIFVYLGIMALCMLSTINARVVIRARRSPQDDGAIDFCAEDTEFPAWKNFFAFVKWCEDGTVGAKPPKPDEGAK